MTTEPQIKPIAETLLHKTRRGEVNWIEEEVGKSGATYAVKLPKAGIVLKFASPVADPDYILLGFRDEKGQVVVAWEVPEPEPAASKVARADWELLHSLFTEARRQATGWDSVLKEVQNALASEGPIGISPARR
jgi:hypothetical protein